MIEIGEAAAIQIADRQSEANEFPHSRIAAPGAQSNPGTKTEASDEKRRSRKFLREKIKHGQNVVRLARAFVVRPFTESNAAKVESDNGQPKPVNCFRGLVNNLVVHRPAEKRMRVADDGGQRRPLAFCLLRRGPQNRFKPTRWTGKHQSSVRLRCHSSTHVTTERRQRTNHPGSPGREAVFRSHLRFSLRFPFRDATLWRTRGALFRGNDGTIDRTPGIAAIYDDASVNGSFQRAGRRRTARTDAGRQFPWALLPD